MMIIMGTLWVFVPKKTIPHVETLFTTRKWPCITIYQQNFDDDDLFIKSTCVHSTDILYPIRHTLGLPQVIISRNREVSGRTRRVIVRLGHLNPAPYISVMHTGMLMATLS